MIKLPSKEVILLSLIKVQPKSTKTPILINTDYIRTVSAYSGDHSEDTIVISLFSNGENDVKDYIVSGFTVDGFLHFISQT